MKKKTLFSALVLSLFLMPLYSAAQLRSERKPQMMSIPNRNIEAKTVSQARNIAITNTVMPLATGIAAVSLFKNETIQTIGAFLSVYGLTMGPSTGNFYAKDYARGFIGLGARAAGLFLMHDATTEIFGRTFADRLYVDDKDVRLTDTKILIGEALVLASTVYNILSTKTSIERYRSSRRKFSLDVTPERLFRKSTPVLTARLRF